MAGRIGMTLDNCDTSHYSLTDVATGCLSTARASRPGDRPPLPRSCRGASSACGWDRTLASCNRPWWRTWRIPAVRMADAHATTTRASTFMYEFATEWAAPRRPPNCGERQAISRPRASHGQAIAAAPGQEAVLFRGRGCRRQTESQPVGANCVDTSAMG